MALPENGKRGNNVLNLEDVRNKHKKSTRTNSSTTHSRKLEDEHTSTCSVENIGEDNNESEFTKECTTVTHPTQNTDTESNNDVIKTPAKRSLVSNRRFDKVKVERIKAGLADGSYEINYLRVADRFIEHERFG